MSGPSPEVGAWLVSAEGREQVAAATAALADSDALEVGTRLRQAGTPGDRAAAVTSVAATRRRARDRYPDADRLLFTPELLEQASHPAVAAWRARRFGGCGEVVDLCCGAGSDAMALCAVAEVVAVDRDRVACLLAAHNLSRRGDGALVVVGDAVTPPVGPGRVIHVDPSRRSGTGRARRLRDYRPPVPSLRPVLDGAGGGAMIVSPGVDLDDPHLPSAVELEFVQVGADLVEAVAWFGGLRVRDVISSATILDPGGQLQVHLEREGPPPELPVEAVGRWLIEVAPAVVRARLHGRVGAGIDAWRIARRRALLSSDSRPEPSPLYRSWEVEAVLPLRPKDVRRWLRDAEDLPLEIATHGLEVDPGSWWSHLGSPPRGPAGRRLHLVRLDDGAAAVATRAN